MALDSGQMAEGGSDAGSDVDQAAVAVSSESSVATVSVSAAGASVVAAAVAPASSATASTSAAVVVVSASDAPANAAATALVPAAAANSADPALEQPFVLAWFDAVCLVAAVVCLDMAEHRNSNHKRKFVFHCVLLFV